MKKGFTLVELVIVIVIIGILSIIAVPIYRGYVDKAEMTEGKALASAIKTAQDIYYAEHGAYYTMTTRSYDPVLGIDVRGNKYFKYMDSRASLNAGAWIAQGYDSRKSSSYVGIIWNIDKNAPVTIDGRRLPVIFINDGGTIKYLSN